jgi:hypothetical protein
MAAVMFFAGAWGYLRLTTAATDGGSLLHSTPLLALGALLGTAVLAGLLVMIRRISPLAAGLPGLALLAWTGLYLASVQRAVNLIPLRSHAFGAGWQGLLGSGLLAAAGAVMVFPLFVPSRWSAPRRGRHAGPDTSARDADDFLATVRPETAGSLTPEAVAALGPDGWPRQREAEPALAGTVVGGPARPPGPARVTGASRALRNSGSFPVTASGLPKRTTGSFPAISDASPRRATGEIPRRATGSFRAAGEAPRRATGALFRNTGSFRTGTDSSLLGRPSPDAGE